LRAQVPVSSLNPAAADLQTYVMRQSPRISHQLVTLNSRTFDVSGSIMTPSSVLYAGARQLPLLTRAQGFASVTPVNILFEENVYCDDGGSFFTVLWINRWIFLLCSAAALVTNLLQAAGGACRGLVCRHIAAVVVAETCPRRRRRR
jgi:hypothetical protein